MSSKKEQYKKAGELLGFKLEVGCLEGESREGKVKSNKAGRQNTGQYQVKPAGRT